MSAPAAIRRAWFGLVLPALLLNYFGQGALVLTDPHAVDSPFYKLAPHWALIPLVGVGGARHHHRVAGADLRRLFAEPAGDADGALPAHADRADVERRSRPDLRADRQLAVDGRHATGGRAVQDLGESRRRLRHRGLRHHADHDASCSIASRSRAGSGRPLWRSSSSWPSAPSTRSFSLPIRSRSSRAAGFRSRSAARWWH